MSTNPRHDEDGGHDEDGERDAWLAEALRHAPDAAAAPPGTLREAILAQARLAVEPQAATAGKAGAAPAARRPAAPSFGERLLGWWSALAQPPVAAGFASVMAAVLVGVMWWDRPMDAALPSPPPPADVPVREAAPTAVTAQATATPQPVATSPATAPTGAAPKEAAPAAAERAKRETAAPARAQVDEAKRRVEPTPGVAPAATRPLAQAEAPQAFPGTTAGAAPALQDAAPPSLAKAAPRPEARAEKREDFDAGRSAAAAAAPVTPPAPAPALAMRQRAAPPAESADARDDLAGLGRAAESSQAAPVARAPRSVRPSGNVAAEPPAAPSTPAAADASAKAAADTPARASAGPPTLLTATRDRPLAAAIAALGDEPALQEWLRRIDAATAGRWQRASAASSGRDVALLRDSSGRVGAWVRIDDDGVRHRAADGSEWFAPLAAEPAARLRAAAPAR